MTPADKLAAITENAGLIGGATAFKLSVGGFNGTAQEVTFIDSGGRAPEVKVAIDYPTVQVIVRGSKAGSGYTAAYAKAKEIFDLLQAIPTGPAQYPELASCIAVGFINWLGRDENSMPRFSLNWQLITSSAPIGNRTY